MAKCKEQVQKQRIATWGHLTKHDHRMRRLLEKRERYIENHLGDLPVIKVT